MFPSKFYFHDNPLQLKGGQILSGTPRGGLAARCQGGRGGREGSCLNRAHCAIQHSFGLPTRCLARAAAPLHEHPPSLPASGSCAWSSSAHPMSIMSLSCAIVPIAGMCTLPISSAAGPQLRGGLKQKQTIVFDSLHPGFNAKPQGRGGCLHSELYSHKGHGSIMSTDYFVF